MFINLGSARNHRITKGVQITKIGVYSSMLKWQVMSKPKLTILDRSSKVYL